MDDLKTTFAGNLRRIAARPNIRAYKPYPGAQTEFHKGTEIGRILVGGNRAGKTVGGACESIWRLQGSHPYQQVKPAPVYGRGSAVDIEQGLKKIMLPEISRWLPPSSLTNGSWEDSYDKQGRLLTLENGSQMDFLTYEMDAEKHAGTSRDFLWFDEEPPEHIFNEDLLRTVDVRGKWYLTMTPVLGMTWLYYSYYEPIVVNGIENKYVALYQAPTEDNPYLPEGAIDIVLEGMSDEEKQARKYGKFMAASGLIYPEFHPGIHCIEPFDPGGIVHPVVTAMDHGLRNPTAWLWSYVDNEGRIVVFHEHYETEKTIVNHATDVRIYEGLHRLGPKISYRIGDPSIANRVAVGNGGSIQSEYADNDVFIGLGNNDVTYGINRTRRMFQSQGILITRDCVNLIREIHGYRWDTYANSRAASTKQPKDTPRKYKDHAVDALRYLVCSRPEMEYRGLAGAIYTPIPGIPHTVPIEDAKYSDFYNEKDNERYHPILGDDW